MVDTRTCIDTLEKTIKKLESDIRQTYCYHEDCAMMISKLSNDATYRDVYGVVTHGDRMEALNYYVVEEAESRRKLNVKKKIVDASKRKLKECEVELQAKENLEFLNMLH